MPSRLAATLVDKWSIPVTPEPGAVRYSTAGNWYHPLARFPGVLIDRDGYVMFETETAYRRCEQIKFGPKGDVGVPRGIRSIAGYVHAGNPTATTEEAAHHAKSSASLSAATEATDSDTASVGAR